MRVEWTFAVDVAGRERPWTDKEVVEEADKKRAWMVTVVKVNLGQKRDDQRLVRAETDVSARGSRMTRKVGVMGTIVIIIIYN